MTNGVRNTLLSLAAFIALVLGLFFYSFFESRTLSPAQLLELGYYGYEQPRVLRPFSLVDQNDNEINADSLKGQWSLLFFGFTFCPDICPTTMGVLARAVEKMPTPPRVILVSVDPERDKPGQLRAYLPGFNSSFIGYTGEFDEIVKLATQLNIAFGKVPGPTEGTYLVDHSASIVVIDPQGRYRGFIKAPHDPATIVTIANHLM